MFDREYRQLAESIDSVFFNLTTFPLDSPSLGQHRLSNQGWCPLEILEHVSLANRFLILTLDKWKKKADRRIETQPLAPGQQEMGLGRIRPIGQRGSFHWKNPDHMAPCGNRSLDDLLSEIRDQANHLKATLHGMRDGRGLLCKITMNVHQLGKINLYQWIAFIVEHARRHQQQLEEIRMDHLLKGWIAE